MPVPIEPGHTFTLREDWTNITNITQDATSSAAKSTSINYVSETASCALLFKMIRNRQRPIYRSCLDNEVAPAGKHVLQPTGTILIFFAKNGEDQTAFDVNSVTTASFELSYTTDIELAADVSYNDLGVFSLVDTQQSTSAQAEAGGKTLPTRLLKHLEDENAE